MSYKIGDIIADKYTVTREFDSANAGQCQWGFVEYNGAEYFIKKFLSPVYPGSLAPGSEKNKQKRRHQCEQFSDRHLAIKKALSSCGEGGLVVTTVDFFSYGNNPEQASHYFKVCQKVDPSSLSNKIHTLEPKERLLVMLTAAFALKILHSKRIIHLDLKPDNILIQKYGSKLIAKIIDFDDSIIEGESIDAESLVGDTVYYSPEFGKYVITNGEVAVPTNKSDIFSLGLIFCQYWTGKLPSFSNTYNYSYEAVLDGKKLLIPNSEGSSGGKFEKKPSRLKGKGLAINTDGTVKSNKNPIEAGIYQLIDAMLLLEPEKRPSIAELHSSLKSLYDKGTLPRENKKPGVSRIRKNFS